MYDKSSLYMPATPNKKLVVEETLNISVVH